MEIFTLVVNGYQAKMNIMVFVWSSNVTNGLLVTIRDPKWLQWLSRGHSWLPIPLITFVEDHTDGTF